VSLETITDPDRDEVVRRVEAAAWNEGKDCAHCGGSGRMEGGRRLVHSTLGAFGADWDAEAIIELVRSSRGVRWGGGFMGHDLAVLNEDGKWVLFQVPHPDREGKS
jgi:hypothetical protein